MAIPLGRRLPGVSSGLPESGRPDRPEAPLSEACFLLGLAPDGVYLARLVTQPAGALLPHRFTLTRRASVPVWRSILCGTFPNLAAGGRYPPSHPVVPGLSSRRRPSWAATSDHLVRFKP